MNISNHKNVDQLNFSKNIYFCMKIKIENVVNTGEILAGLRNLD